MVEEGSSGAVSGIDVDRCVIYRQEFENDKVITVIEKGMMSLISFSKECGHSMLHTHLLECISLTPIGKSWCINAAVEITPTKEGSFAAGLKRISFHNYKG